jgi:hypothetical protein
LVRRTSSGTPTGLVSHGHSVSSNCVCRQPS